MLSKMRSGARMIFLWKHQSSSDLNIWFSTSLLSPSKPIGDFPIRFMEAPPKQSRKAHIPTCGLHYRLRQGRVGIIGPRWPGSVFINSVLGRHRLEQKGPLNDCLSPPARSMSASALLQFASWLPLEGEVDGKAGSDRENCGEAGCRQSELLNLTYADHVFQA